MSSCLTELLLRLTCCTGLNNIACQTVVIHKQLDPTQLFESLNSNPVLA